MQTGIDFRLFSGPITKESMANLWTQLYKDQKTETLGLLLTTHGGDAHAAYKIAKKIKSVYKKFQLYIFGPCKSAGTLIACGADEIIFSIEGEMGPLDVQVARQDDLIRSASGLDEGLSITYLSEKYANVFHEFFLGLLQNSGGRISTKTALDTAAQMCNGLFSPIAQQIDTSRLGENYRAMNIAFAYGIRLGASDKTLNHLLNQYPSHAFVIDAAEAGNLFPGKVRLASEEELKLESSFKQQAIQKFKRDIVAYPEKNCTYLQLTIDGALNEKQSIQDSRPTIRKDLGDITDKSNLPSESKSFGVPQ